GRRVYGDYAACHVLTRRSVTHAPFAAVMGGGHVADTRVEQAGAVAIGLEVGVRAAADAGDGKDEVLPVGIEQAAGSIVGHGSAAMAGNFCAEGLLYDAELDKAALDWIGLGGPGLLKFILGDLALLDAQGC